MKRVRHGMQPGLLVQHDTRTYTRLINGGLMQTGSECELHIVLSVEASHHFVSVRIMSLTCEVSILKIKAREASMKLKPVE